MDENIDGVLLTPLKIISMTDGNVLHGMKCSDQGYLDFGEAYFSMIETGVVKAWKRHKEMTLNIVVPLGEVRFVIYDDRDNFSSQNRFQEVILSVNNYQRLTVPPMLWFGFQGLHKNTSMLLNIANIEHSSEEVDRKKINEIKYNWEFNK
jgi:dTDP-4-dehydrorhamnose 3,5-epimerase